MSGAERDIILEVKDVSKVYHLNQKFQASIKDVFSSRTKPATSTYTALQDISFQLRKGESLGIFGANGAGKSTLLRILTGITKPSTGVVDIYGRSLSILEIGTGFHPDLTGKENIFSNGEILGMERHVIESKLDEIIAFSELGEYINEPVKNYSSGMYLRLAFSVIAFLEADLMLFDETMSVGDLSFRKKCRDKIESMLKAGKSMVVVSHNMNEIISLCNKFMHLENGKIQGISDSYDILAKYINKSITPKTGAAKNEGTLTRDNRLEITDFSGYDIPDSLELQRIRLQSIETGKTDPTETIYRDQELELTIEFLKKSETDCFDVSFSIVDGAGNIALSSSPVTSNQYFNFTGAGKCRVRCLIPKDLFNRGQFYINMYFLKNRNSMALSLNKIISYQVQIRQDFQGVNPDLMNVPGALAPAFDWLLSWEKI